MTNKKIEDIEFEPFEGKNLHPSLDIQDGLAVLGFRYRNKDNEEQEICVVSTNGSVFRATENPIVINDQKFWFDKRPTRKLARLEEKWGSENLKKYLEERTSLTYESISGHTVFNELVDNIRLYLELEDDSDYDLLAAWVLGTYFYPIFSAYPFIHLKAPKGSGKSQCLTLLTQLCFNAVKAAPTVASLGDTVDALRGTYLVDQANSLARQGREDLLDIFCDSYKFSGGKRRIISMDKARGGRDILEFETYSPKAFASTKELPEDLRDRCFILQLKRSSINNFPDAGDRWIVWNTQRAKCYELLLAEHVTVDGEYLQRRSHYKTDTSIVGRKLELWLPLEVMLRLFGPSDKIDAIKRRFFVLYGSAEYEPGELEFAVIEFLQEELTGREEMWFSPKEISENVPPTSFYENTKSGKQMASAIGWVIKKFDLASEKKHTRDGNSYLFRKDKVEKIYASYFKTASDPASPSSSETETQNIDDFGADAEV